MKDRIDRLMENPQKGLITLATPMIISTVFSTVLNLVDFFFVGGLGPNALAAVQVSFPVFFLIISLGQGLIIGSTALISKRMGEKNKKWAEETGLHALFMALVLSALFTFMALGTPQIAESLRVGPQVTSMASDYMQVIFMGSTVFFLVFALQSILQGEGHTRMVMKVSLIFTFLNAALDPPFIYWLNMGVGGAAIATVIAAGVALAYAAWHIIWAKRSYLQINLREFIYTPQIIKNIFRVGIPAAASHIGLAASIFGFNFILAGFGDSFVSAYGIAFRIDSFAILPVLGLSGGLIPLIGYFRGAKDYKGAHKANRLALKMSLAFGLLVTLVVFLVAPYAGGLFTSDGRVIALSAEYLQVRSLSYVFAGMAIVISAAFQGMGRGMPSLVITLLRSLLLVLPLAFIFSRYWEMAGAALGIVIATIVAAILSFLWIEQYFKRICSECYAGEIEPPVYA
jgi:putative MATE family efflux protein